MRTFVDRQPLVLRAIIALILMGLVRLAAFLGWIPPEWGDVDQAAIERILDLVILGVTWWSTHRKVTSVAAPRDNHGRPLVPVFMRGDNRQE